MCPGETYPTSVPEASVSARKPGPDQDLTRRGTQRQRHARYYLVCPACGKSPISPIGLRSHLMGSGCVRKHTADEAHRLKALAPRDPLPFKFEVERLQRVIAEVEAMVKDAPRSARSTAKAALATFKLSLELLWKMGHERYEIDHPSRDPYAAADGQGPELAIPGEGDDE